MQAENASFKGGFQIVNVCLRIGSDRPFQAAAYGPAPANTRFP